MIYTVFLVLFVIFNAFCDPLLLTPLIDEGKIDLARNLSTVLWDDVYLGHSGFLTVPSPTKTRKNNIFFWFQKCQDKCNPYETPFLIWLQGGPGGAGTFGAFLEIGNFWIDKNIHLRERGFSWCAHYNCLFVDQPVYSGYSYQTTNSGERISPDAIEFTNNSPDAMDQIYGLLQQFFTAFPEYSSAPFHITGESYGGIYCPTLAMTIENHNKALNSGETRINLQGMAVGDPLIFGKVQFPSYGSSLYAMGVLMNDEREEIDHIMREAVKYWDDCPTAYKWFNSVFNDDGSLPTSKFLEFTGSEIPENILLADYPEEMGFYREFLNSTHVAMAFHYDGSPAIGKHLGVQIYDAFVYSGDVCSNSSWEYATAFIEYGVDVMIYSSTVDPILGPPTTEAGIKSVWEYAVEKFGEKGERAKDAFYSAKKVIWKVKKDDTPPAGYAKCFQNPNDEFDNRFCYVVVRNAGHMTPCFQPRSSYDMINRFVMDREWTPSGDDPDLPTCAQCAGQRPLAGYALPDCVC